MNRRDLLKLIGIGGAGAVASAVSGKEVEAAETPAPKPVVVEPAVEEVVSYLNALYGSGDIVAIGSVSIGHVNQGAYPFMGTGIFRDGVYQPGYGEYGFGGDA